MPLFSLGILFIPPRGNACLPNVCDERSGFMRKFLIAALAVTTAAVSMLPAQAEARHGRDDRGGRDHSERHSEYGDHHRRSNSYGYRYYAPRPYYHSNYRPTRWVREGYDLLLIDVRNGRILQVRRNYYW
jgi:Ni/Co efflux regulator RcnB